MKKITNLLLIALLSISTGFGARAMKLDKKELVERLVGAEMEGDLDKVKHLVESGADVNAEIHGTTPFRWAVEHGPKDIVKYLLDCGADVNAIDANSYTALMSAAQRGCWQIVECLIKSGADLNVKTVIRGWTALMFAAFNGISRSCEVIVEEMLRLEEEHRRAIYCFLLCYKKAKENNSILACLPKEIAQLIAKCCWNQLPKARVEVGKITRQAIKQHLLAKYFPANEIKN